MPFAVIDGIIIDPSRRAECLSAVRAANEHHIGPGCKTGRLHGRKHVDIVVIAGPGAIGREENLANESGRVYRITGINVAAEINRRTLIETWRNAPVFRIR